MKFFLVIFLLLGFIQNYSQSTIDHDTNYIQTFEKNFYPYTFINTRNYYISIYDNEHNAYTDYYPDAFASFGVGLDYKWMTLNYSVSLISKRDRKGKNVNFGYGITRRKFRVSMLYQNYKGFSQYHTNLRDTISFNLPDSVVPFRPNLKNQSFQLSSFYMFNNKRASYRSAFLYFEKQLKSAGSFTVGSNLYYSKVEAEKSLLGWQLDTIVPEEEIFKKSSNINISINGGGFYTFVFFKNFHLSAYGVLNIYYAIDLDENRSGESSSPWGGGIDYRFMLGYDNNKIFAGISLAGNSFSKNNISNSFSTNYAIFELYFGKRFNLHFRRKNKFIDIEE